MILRRYSITFGYTIASLCTPLRRQTIVDPSLSVSFHQGDKKGYLAINNCVSWSIRYEFYERLIYWPENLMGHLYYVYKRPLYILSSSSESKELFIKV